MKRKGLDYAWYRPTMGELHSKGVHFVCRYVSYDKTGKNITKSEYDQLRANKIDIVLNWEYSARDALKGADRGKSDMSEAVRQAQALGYPHGATIYLSVDFDATPQECKTINRYLRGARRASGPYRVGVYGGYWVVKRALDAKECRFAWQTYAWSGGQWDKRARIRQVHNGAQYDHDLAVRRNYGSVDTHGRRRKARQALKRRRKKTRKAISLSNRITQYLKKILRR